MGFLRDLVRKYQGGNTGCLILEDLVETSAEKHLRAWIKKEQNESAEDYAQAIKDTNLVHLRKEDQIVLADAYYAEKGGLIEDYKIYGLALAIELSAQTQVDTLVKLFFLEMASAGLALRDSLLRLYESVDLKHQNPYRDISPQQVSERHGFSFYEYLVAGELAHVYISDYPYLAFVAKKLK